MLVNCHYSDNIEENQTKYIMNEIYYICKHSTNLEHKTVNISRDMNEMLILKLHNMYALAFTDVIKPSGHRVD